jgi:hypothetical protein
MMQYNILCTVKRFESYETLGELFNETTGNTLELSVTDKIWELNLDGVLEVAEIVSADAGELLSALIEENPKFHKLLNIYKVAS